MGKVAAIHESAAHPILASRLSSMENSRVHSNYCVAMGTSSFSVCELFTYAIWCFLGSFEVACNDFNGHILWGSSELDVNDIERLHAVSDSPFVILNSFGSGGRHTGKDLEAGWL